jgi:hypothetical protein
MEKTMNQQYGMSLTVVQTKLARTASGRATQQARPRPVPPTVIYNHGNVANTITSISTQQ